MNWATKEAWNLLTNCYQDIYEKAISEPFTHDHLEALLIDVLERIGTDIEHLMFHEIDFDQLIKRFEDSIRENANE